MKACGTGLASPATGGGHAPGRRDARGAPIEKRRFRPNIYVDSLESEDLVEDAWLGRSIRIGERVVVHETNPTLWRVTLTLAQEDLQPGT